MKKQTISHMGKIALIAYFATASLHAEDDAVKQQRLKVMNTYAGALHTLQDGFLYNSKSKLLSGAKTVLDTAKEVQSHDIKAHLPKDQAYTYQFAKKITERIIVHAENVIDATERGNPLEAMDEFNYIIKQCTSCHLRVRGW